jgi:hypothetical protein
LNVLKKIAVLFSLVVSMGACNDSPIQPEEKVETRVKFIRASILKHQKLAAPCANPAIPKKGVRDGKDWRYGCFCGQGYPLIDESLPRELRIERYFTVEPKDSIDTACRNHDICWSYFGDGDPGCSQIYIDELSTLFEAYLEARKSLPPKINGRRPFSKCTQTILDQQFAFSSAFVKAEYESFGDRVSSRIARWLFATPILGALAFLFTGGVQYPGVDELCNYPSIRPVE